MSTNRFSSITRTASVATALGGSALCLLLAGCKNNPSGSPATTSNLFRFGPQTQQSVDQFKQQAQATAQAGNNAIKAGSQDIQKSVNTQLSNLDAQRAQLTSQIQTSTGQAKQQLEGQLASLDAQRNQLASQVNQTGQSLQQNFQQTTDALNQSARQIQQTFTNPLPPPGPVPSAPPPILPPPTR